MARAPGYQDNDEGEEETKWVECVVCGISTAPDANPPFEPDLTVVGDPGNRRIVHEHCREEGFPSGLDQFL